MSRSSHILIIGLIMVFGFSSLARIEPACYPDPNDPYFSDIYEAYSKEEVDSWPVGLIHLHGWDHVNNGKNGSKDEQANRETLRQLAKKMASQHVRIAMPVANRKRSQDNKMSWGPGYDTKGNLQSGYVPIDQVEEFAKQACGGSDVELAMQRAISGYSNGGYAVGRYASQCKEKRMKPYTRYISIGAPTISSSNACGNLKKDGGHSSSIFAGRIYEYLTGWNTAPLKSPRPRPRPDPSAPSTPTWDDGDFTEELVQ